MRSGLFVFYFMLGMKFVMRHKGNSVSHHVLGCLLFLWSMELLKDLISQHYPWFSLPVVRHTYLLLDVTAIPMCAFFVMSTADENWLTQKRIWRHLLPFVLFPVVYAISHLSFVFYVDLCFCVFYGLVMVKPVFRNLKLYEADVRLSDTLLGFFDLYWLHITVVMLFGNLVFCIYLYWNVSVSLFYLYYIYCCVMWCFTVYHVARKQYSLSVEAVMTMLDNIVDEETDMQVLSEEEKVPVWQKKFHLLFDIEQMYLKPNINMSQIATMIGTNRSYLSVYLNKNLHANFYDYVNRYRLEYAEKLIINLEFNL